MADDDDETTQKATLDLGGDPPIGEATPPPSEEVAQTEGVDAEAGPAPKVIIPLGPVSSQTLLECDQNPFILDKLFHEGTISKRLNPDDADSKKPGNEASSAYEDYDWQLERDFRKVPASMSLGSVRLKPDALLYEGESFILGKLDRDLRLADGYVPTAGRRESTLDFQEAIEINNGSLPPEPKPCPVPTIAYNEEEGCGVEKQESVCTKKIMANGKIYEFSFSGTMAGVAIDGNNGAAAASAISAPFQSTLECQETDDVAPSTPFDLYPKSYNNKGPLPVTQQFPSEQGCCSSSSHGQQNGLTCRNNMPCNSQNQAVCTAARKAMAIYDTVTGCDNFPCNVGDKSDLEMENVEEGVWSWLYSLIYKMVPLEADGQ